MALSTLLTNLTWGVRRGVAFAALYSAWVTVVRVFGPSDAFSRQGVSYAGVVGTYLVLGLVSGALVGALRPLTRWSVGAYAVGCLAGMIIAAGIVTCADGLPARWDAAAISFIPVAGLIAGLAVLGPQLAKASRRETATKSV